MRGKFLNIFFIFFIFTFNSIFSQEKIVYKIDIKKEIGSTTWVYVQNGLKNAKELNADIIFIDMNTYGGTVVHADSIRTAILYNEIPVYVFIDNNAASAGALIAISCDSIYMKKGANIGAATVVNQTGEAMPDKYQSYMRSTMRSTAEAKGKDTLIIDGKTTIKWRRDPQIAEAMVDERVYIPNVIDSTRVLTLTTDEAIKLNYCEAEANSIDEILTNRFLYKDYVIKKYKPTFFDEIKGWLTSPGLQAILITIIVIGIFYEIKTPGMGLPSIAAVIAAFLYFFPLFIDGLADYWEIAIFILGVILIMVEIFAIPGFGILGFSGLIFMIVGLVLALINNVNFSFENVAIPDINRSIYTVIAGILSSFIVIIITINRFGKGHFFRNISLTKEELKSEGYIAIDNTMNEMLDKEGYSSTFLHPSGKIRINNDYYDAISIYGFIEPNKKIKVVRFENAQLYVIQID